METHIYPVSTNLPSQGIYIGNYIPLGSPVPDSFAQLTRLPDSSLQLTMWSYDSPAQSASGSWLACYLNCFPRYRYKGYLAIEFSVDGTCQCSFGPNRSERTPIATLGIPPLNFRISRTERDGGPCWMGQVLIPRKTLDKLYGFTCHLEAGHKMRGNFYAFQGTPGNAPLASWAPLGTGDAHLSEYFGLLEIL